MNNIAISPYIAMHYLQIQNVKRNSVKVAEPSDEDAQHVILDSPKEISLPIEEDKESSPKKSEDVDAAVNNVSTLNHNPLNSHSDIFDTVTEITSETK